MAFSNMLLPRISNNGFGLVSVIGVRRVPSPAHRIMARSDGFLDEFLLDSAKGAESRNFVESSAESTSFCPPPYMDIISFQILPFKFKIKSADFSIKFIISQNLG